MKFTISLFTFALNVLAMELRMNSSTCDERIYNIAMDLETFKDNHQEFEIVEDEVYEEVCQLKEEEFKSY